MAPIGSPIPVDPLNLLREAIAKDLHPVPISDPSATDPTSLEDATHLFFNIPKPGDAFNHHAIDLTTSTRFVSQRAGAPLDLLSVYFSWTNKDTGLTEYISAVQALDAKRREKGLGGVTNVVFTERVDLASWLSGENDESEFIKSADNTLGARQAAAGAAEIASGSADVHMGDGAGHTGLNASLRADEERVKAIGKLERSMGDRNTVLRGIKPTDFSHVRKSAEVLLRRSSSRSGQPSAVAVAAANAISRPLSKSSSSKRLEPIILLSPSASSLLRLANIKSFLDDGVYTSVASSNTGANILHITRTLPTIDPGRETRLILVESPDNFKPDYWNRVVAVFTTGQAWQFKGYKWQNPAELFTHALGIFVGWRGETVPDAVKGWGRGVLSVAVEKWREGQTAQQRWRDREVVEEVWSAIEGSMRARGWGKDTK